MRFITITIVFAVTGKLVALAIAKPIPNWKPSGGIAIPLTRHPSSLNSNTAVDLDAITSHAISIREYVQWTLTSRLLRLFIYRKILNGLDNYELNTGRMHPFAVKRSESRLGRRGASLPLTPTSRGNGWMAEISIGTPPKTLNGKLFLYHYMFTLTYLTVHIDTGAA
jgi:hypothetical protein